MNKGYKLISSKEMRDGGDPEIFEGRNMWEERIRYLNALFNKLFDIFLLLLLLSYALFIINFIASAILAKGVISALFITCFIQIGVASLIYIVARLIIKIIAHHLESTEIYYANMTINKEEGKKDE